MVNARPRHSSGRLSRSRAFTLIEMLVVMTLIALLLTLAVPRYFGAIDSGKATVQRRNAATIRDAIDKFNADVGRYPESLEELVTRRYLRQIPIDPVAESFAWVIVAPADPTQGNVYDVLPPAAVPTAAAVAAAAASQPGSVTPSAQPNVTGESPSVPLPQPTDTLVPAPALQAVETSAATALPPTAAGATP